MKRKLNILLILIVIITISGCMKSKEEKLVGVWEVVPLDEYEAQRLYTWTFNEDGTIYRERTHPDQSKNLDTAIYTKDFKNFKAFITITNLNLWPAATEKDYNGKYQIDKLNNNELFLVRIEDLAGNKTFFRREFKRKK